MFLAGGEWQRLRIQLGIDLREDGSCVIVAHDPWQGGHRLDPKRTYIAHVTADGVAQVLDYLRQAKAASNVE